jgi:hypothetical protein
MFVGLLTLLSALSISAVAIYYSVIGLTAIFSAAATAIITMGVVLELGKLVTVLWLHQNWTTAPKLVKGYLSTALVVLMLITSMGIFGFLSKAHMDQSVPTGDVADKVALIDEKIKTQRDNIDTARKALAQMDSQVDQMLGRSDDERGAERAVQIRRNQAKERSALQADIAKAQTVIASLNEERAPIAKELRKVEAEVGPIKYIANFFYGDTDSADLETAVTWVIIILIVVFDPLAIVLLIAAQLSLQGRWNFKFSSPAEPVVAAPVVAAPAPDINKEIEEANSLIAEIPKEPDVDSAIASAEEVKQQEVSALDQWNKMIEEAEREVAKVDETRLQDTAATEAIRWAQEQEALAQEEIKKKELTWFEKDGPNQVKKSRPE